MRYAGVIVASFLSFFAGCAQDHQQPRLPAVSPADSSACVQDNLTHRAQVDDGFRNDPGSPFHRDTSISFTGINWYPIDVRFRSVVPLHRYPDPEIVRVMGTKGEPREQLRYGYFLLLLPDSAGMPVQVRLNVYKFTPSDSMRYARYRNHLSMWFTDLTRGKETYHVGRYIELGEEQADPDARYIVDLNKAFNPYCAYSALYSCAIPTEEDRITIPLRVGERKYHE
jgi:uncharacterized protein (DUF1684 family)